MLRVKIYKMVYWRFSVPKYMIEQGSPDLKAGKEVADYLGTVHHEFHFTVQVSL